MATSQLGSGMQSTTRTSVLIVGAGLSGICTAINLIKRNQCRDFIIIEKSAGPGGVWHDNTYPGCGCDIFAALYCFSFEQNPHWTREYPSQAELLDYVHDVAQKYKLFQHIRFASTVEEARWDDETGQWRTQVSVAKATTDSEARTSYEVTSDFLISAVGQLNKPKWPDIPGLDSFQGDKLHSARWDWSVELANKRVALLGNGCSAVQILPEIVKVAQHVTVYQRTPAYVTLKLDRPIHAAERYLYQFIRPLLWAKRALQMTIADGMFDFVYNSDSLAAKGLASFCFRAINANFPDDPEMQDKLKPNFTVGAKRMILSNDWYPALAKPNCTLETRPIRRITQNGVEVGASKDLQTIDADLLICATGFLTQDFIAPMQLYGRNGRDINDVWKVAPQALYGMTVEDMPNFAMLYGPNTNLGHSAITLMVEAQARYIATLVKAVQDAKNRGRSLTIRPKSAVMQQYNEGLQAKLQNSVWNDKSTKSWYTNEAGVITNNWSGTVVEYQKLLSKVKFNDYETEGDTTEIDAKPVVNIGRVVEEVTLLKTATFFGMLGAGAYAIRWASQHSQELKSWLF